MKKTNTARNIVLVLHDIRSTHNVGSIFRTADAIGVSKIILSSITPAPLDRFSRPSREIAKTALGAEKNIPWQQVKNITTYLRQFKKENYYVVAVEQSPKSIDYKKLRSKKKMVFILGNEVSGLPSRILALSDVTIAIPMHGKKESLNVSVAAGITLFRTLDII